MKKIYIRKTLCYDPTFKGKYSKYQGYSKILLVDLDPSIEKITKVDLKVKFDAIYHSSLLRGRESAIAFSSTKNNLEKLDYLNEIIFDLNDLVTENQYQSMGSNIVRKRFIEAFIEDRLLEKRQKIKQRIGELISFLHNLENGSYLLVSHSFFMKILQSYLMENTLFENPEILTSHFNFKQKTFDFGDGFNFNL